MVLLVPFVPLSPFRRLGLLILQVRHRAGQRQGGEQAKQSAPRATTTESLRESVKRCAIHREVSTSIHARRSDARYPVGAKHSSPDPRPERAGSDHPDSRSRHGVVWPLLAILEEAKAVRIYRKSYFAVRDPITRLRLEL
jgi:hypothetical protein